MVGVLLWTAGCRKEDPTSRSCNDGTCCNFDNATYDYEGYIRDAPAALVVYPDGGKSLFMEKPLPTETNPAYQVSQVAVCDINDEKLKGLPLEPEAVGTRVHKYNYRITAKVYSERATHLLIQTKVVYILIDRIVLVQ